MEKFQHLQPIIPQIIEQLVQSSIDESEVPTLFIDTIEIEGKEIEVAVDKDGTDAYFVNNEDDDDDEGVLEYIEDHVSYDEVLLEWESL